MTLGEKQELFVSLECIWVQWVHSKGWKLRHGEGRILERGPTGKKGRRAFQIRDGAEVGVCFVRDAVHMAGGTHYMGIGADWQLFVKGQWISNGSDPAWLEAGAHWKTLHPLTRWGGDFEDANHISLEHLGKK